MLCLSEVNSLADDNLDDVLLANPYDMIRVKRETKRVQSSHKLTLIAAVEHTPTSLANSEPMCRDMTCTSTCLPEAPLGNSPVRLHVAWDRGNLCGDNIDAFFQLKIGAMFNPGLDSSNFQL